MSRGIPKSVLEMLSAVPLFSTCTKSELRTIANLGTRVHVADGAVLIEQGKPGREFFLLVEGGARCIVDGEQVAIFGAGDFFGEMALLDRRPRNATVVATADSEVLVLSASEFHGLLDSAPTITKKLLLAVAERERDPKLVEAD
jgi:CRP-like cAMP-binding protein